MQTLAHPAPAVPRFAAYVRRHVQRSQDAIASVDALAPTLDAIARALTTCFANGGRAYFFGNGGSAADAQHWAAELSGRFMRERGALAALALPTGLSEMTAIANDYGYDQVFARPLSAFVQPGDVALGISTSGRSPNVLKALSVARERGAITVGFTGRHGGAMPDCCDHIVRVPADVTAHVQEAHAVCGHVICGLVEGYAFGWEDPS
ncbi:MAG: D-sedoheptulose 7-phosphate isomerase [Bacteroidota bacterium]